MSLLKKFIKLSSLKSDMVNRIMYSSLINVVPNSQYTMSNGVIDQKALDLAANGVLDILKFGTISCINEYNHARMRIEDLEDIRINLLNDLSNSNKTNVNNKIDEIIFVLSSLKDAFIDPRSMFPTRLYGGESWSKIATILLTLATLQKNLINLDKNDFDKANNIKKQIVMNLNVFDGLAHNTGTVYTHMAENEKEEIKKSISSEGKTEYNLSEYKKYSKIVLSNAILNLIESIPLNKINEKIKNKIKFSNNNVLDLIEYYNLVVNKDNNQKSTLINNQLAQLIESCKVIENNKLDLEKTINDIKNDEISDDEDNGIIYNTSYSFKVFFNLAPIFSNFKLNEKNMELNKKNMELNKKPEESGYSKYISEINDILNLKDLKSHEDLFYSLEKDLSPEEKVIYKDYISAYKGSKYYNSDKSGIDLETDKVILNKLKNDFDSYMEKMDSNLNKLLELKQNDKLDKKSFNEYTGNIYNMLYSIRSLFEQKKFKSEYMKGNVSNISGAIQKLIEILLQILNIAYNKEIKEEDIVLINKFNNYFKKIKFKILELFV